MSPETATILCLTIAGLGLAFAWWSVVRVTLYQANAQRVRRRLDAAMRLRGTTDDPGYLFVRFLITRSIPVSRVLTPLFMGEIARSGQARPMNEAGVEKVVRAVNVENMLPEVSAAGAECLVRFVLFLICYPPNLPMFLYLMTQGRPEKIAAFLSRPLLDRRAFDYAATTRP